MAIGTLLIPTTIDLLPALIGGGAISVILNNMGFKVPAPIVPKTSAGESVDVAKAFAEAHSEVEALATVTVAAKAEAHAFLNRVEKANAAIEAVKELLDRVEKANAAIEAVKELLNRVEKANAAIEAVKELLAA